MAREGDKAVFNGRNGKRLDEDDEKKEDKKLSKK